MSGCNRFKGNTMRIATLALTLILSFGAWAASAQTSIDADDQKLVPTREQAPKPAQADAQNSNRSQVAPQATTVSRFSFSYVENGFMRLDNSTGEVAYCAQLADWSCQVVPINRAPDIESVKKDISSLNELKTEIARLQEDVAALKKEIGALKEPSTPRPPADLTPPSGKGSDVTIKLPSPEEMTRAREFIEATWRRLVEMIVTVQKDLMRKS